MPTEVRPLVSRIAVVYLYVRDVDRSCRFYRDLLGIPLDGDEQWVEATLPGGVRFALHRVHDGVGELSSGTVHVDLQVEDASAAAERLRAAGVEVRETMREDWGTAVEVLDPDGYRLYLLEPAG